MRVLMTGGYGCIGSWVARQLVEAGQEVWIYDLKEDTHRLDLILDPEQMIGGPLSSPETSPTSMRSGQPWSDSRQRTSFIWRGCKRRPAGLIRSWARRSMCSARWPSLRQRWPSRTRCDGLSTPARRRYTALPTQVRQGRSPTSSGSPADALRGIQGLQRAQCPGVLARSWDHQRRPASLDRLRRRPRFRHDERADQGDQGRGPGRPYRISYGGRQDLQYVGRRRRDVRPRTDPAVRGGRPFNLRGTVAPIEAFVAALGNVFPRPARSSPTATANCRSPPTLTIAGCRAGSDRFHAPPSKTASPKLTAGSSSYASTGGSMIRICLSRDISGPD